MLTYDQMCCMVFIWQQLRKITFLKLPQRITPPLSSSLAQIWQRRSINPYPLGLNRSHLVNHKLPLKQLWWICVNSMSADMKIIENKRNYVEILWAIKYVIEDLRLSGVNNTMRPEPYGRNLVDSILKCKLLCFDKVLSEKVQLTMGQYWLGRWPNQWHTINWTNYVINYIS